VISFSGGVSANRALREAAGKRAEATGIGVRFAERELRTDNALMIAYAGMHHFLAGAEDGLSRDVSPNFEPSTFCC
jgi:N6-L-threonylcarbamoyladenine synthase